MKKILIVFILTLAPSVSFATVMSGNEFLEMYNSKTTYNLSLLNMYMAGWYDTIESSNPSLAKCLGNDVKMSQLVDTVGNYLKNNPQVRHYNLNQEYVKQIKIQFNCK
jgi:hypothetical protein